MDTVRIAPDGRGFVLKPSGQRFVPYGFNYGVAGRLLEDDWVTSFPEMAGDFREMKAMGANVARVHLQFGRFMDGPDAPSRAALSQLGKLLRLAERTGVYLDITGLACYRPADVPPWYDKLDERGRWRAQARFWEAVAARCADSPAVFCYDLMNEPISPGERREPSGWYSGALLGGLDFIQWISLDPAGRPRDQIARDWVRELAAAIRSGDRCHMITVGLLPTKPPGVHFSGFIPAIIAPDLDFVSVHIYPETGKRDEAVAVLKDFVTSKPLIIEETFPFTCNADELRPFLDASRGIACGWIGHYWGETIPELERLRAAGRITIPQACMLDWLKLFEEFSPLAMAAPGPGSDGPSTPTMVARRRGVPTAPAAPKPTTNSSAVPR